MSNVFSFDDDDEEAPLFEDEPTETEFQDDGEQPDDEEEEGESGNRTFIILGIVLGVILFCTLVGGGIYALLVLPGQQAARLDAQSTMIAVNTEAAIAVAQTQEVLNFTPTLPPTETPTETPTVTPVVVDASTETPGVGLVEGAGGADAAEADEDANATATVVALNTELASSQLTVTVMPAVTELSDTGFADNVGLPGLIVGTMILVAVIFLARRLREAPARK